ncbi:scavenger receptor class B member 1-like [Rhinoraja longicauda]
MTSAYLPLAMTSAYLPLAMTSAYLPLAMTSAYLPLPMTSAYLPLAMTSAYLPLAMTSAYLPLAMTSAYLPLAMTSAYLPLAMTSAYLPLAMTSAYLPLAMTSAYLPLAMTSAYLPLISLNSPNFKYLSTSEPSGFRMTVVRQRMVHLLVAGLLLATVGLVLLFTTPLIIREQVIKAGIESLCRRGHRFIIVIIIIFTIIIIIVVVVIPSGKQSHLRNVQIDPGNSFAYSVWKDVPIPFYMSVYFFHIVNPDAIIRGEKPVVEQRGPYVYREYRPKGNITFHENHTVSYRVYRQFHFVPERSCGNESDQLVLPNMLALGISILAEKLPPPLKIIFNFAMKEFNQTAFYRKTIKEIMWGYEDELIIFLKKHFPSLLPFKDTFGLFADLNNTDTGLFRIYTGVDDIRKVQGIDTWNGCKKVNYWHSDQCNMINGTSGELWPPFLTPSDTLEFYSPDACRSLELVYQRSDRTFGLPSFHYVAPKTMFANGTVFPPNQGFCPCRQSGVLNVSTCRHNSQVFISHPHFYNGDPALWEAVDGLHPLEKDHALFIDIHPMTGVPLNFSIKLQLNLFLKNVKGIPLTGKMRTMLLPLMWFDESGNISGPILDNFYMFMAVIPLMLQILQYLLLAIAALLLASAAILAFISMQQKRSKRGPHEPRCGGHGFREGEAEGAAIKAQTRF